MQGKRQRQVPPVLQQHKQDLSRGDSAPEMLPRDGSKQEQDVAVLASKRQVAGSGQPSTSKVGETNMVELTDVAQQANVRRERTADNLKATQSRADIVHATASAVSANTKAAAVPTFQPSSHCRAEHLVAWASAAAADESLAGAVNNTQLNTGPAIVTAEASSNRSQSAPSSANAGSMSTPTPGISDRRDSVGQQALLHMPEESRHSKGLQQLWNCVAHTPLTVPSPCSMTGNCRMQHRRQTSFEEQGHQRVLVPDLATPSQVLQSSTASSSAASEVTEGATALSVGLAVEDAVTPDR